MTQLYPCSACSFLTAAAFQLLMVLAGHANCPPPQRLHWLRCLDLMHTPQLPGLLADRTHRE
eukprot:1138547-Pelagomonas_calceolata.AAC.11